MAERLSPRTPDLGLGFNARRVVSLEKELCSRLSLFTQVYKSVALQLFKTSNLIGLLWVTALFVFGLGSIVNFVCLFFFLTGCESIP